MKASLTVFTASIEPKTSPADKVSPTVGTSTNTMSPNWLCAKSVMPIKAVTALYAAPFVVIGILQICRYVHNFRYLNWLK